MKVQKSLLFGLTTVAIAFTATPTFSQSSSNSNTLFGCEIIKDTPTTVAYNPKNQEEYKPLIKWEKEYIESQDLVSHCQRAAKILKNRYDKEELGLWGLELNSNNQTAVICLINQRGKSCNLSGEEFFRVKNVKTAQDFYKALSAIVVPPNIIELDEKTIKDKFRAGAVDQTYSRMRPRSWFQILFQ
ncbi:hypothetical protein PI95_018405 [Hassallia byssoidea VB512170]|uniref:Uncharacterized protein n=1 Tax=Hassallia byssoidea VB512170 TaxID=1304833 RepID=A0A846HA60_9CYAN|nr:COP23 domain-containing protein [Hassalia byssoidea]NEU74477.1 hypothetical protein [Hassalia byssoidea VB512170]